MLHEFEFEEHGVTASIHRGNVGSAEDCRPTIGEVIERHGRLDVLVNNAGITSDKSVTKMSDEDWYKVLAVNLSGAFFMSQAALPHMLETIPDKVLERIKSQIPMGRFGRPDDVARVVHFLAADNSSFITGQVWGVNGGQDM